MIQTTYLVQTMEDFAANGLWEYASQQVQDAHTASDNAYRDLLDAQGEVEDAELALEQARLQYDLDGRRAVMEKTALPDRQTVEAASWALDNAKTNLLKKTAEWKREQGALTSLLAQAGQRDEWRSNLNEMIHNHRTKAQTLADQVALLQAELTKAAGFTVFLGEFGVHAQPPLPVEQNAVGALMELATLEPWKPGRLAVESGAKFAQPEEPGADLPSQYLVNPSGAVHLVSGKDFEKFMKQVGFRPATEAEIQNEQRREAGQI